mmetsp:Transcript_17705/g.50147  ORF Transcript_17705/g.50147 Transcript_17705/m.50147 type:complete len:213 (+) Transcript_17705:204-842(+)
MTRALPGSAQLSRASMALHLTAVSLPSMQAARRSTIVGLPRRTHLRSAPSAQCRTAQSRSTRSGASAWTARESHRAATLNMAVTARSLSCGSSLSKKGASTDRARPLASPVGASSRKASSAMRRTPLSPSMRSSAIASMQCRSPSAAQRLSEPAAWHLTSLSALCRHGRSASTIWVFPARTSLQRAPSAEHLRVSSGSTRSNVKAGTAYVSA